MELETLQKRHREELERFQQHQLQLLIQQQQQASALHQHQHHPLLYHTVASTAPGKIIRLFVNVRSINFLYNYKKLGPSRPLAVEDYLMFSSGPQASFRRISNYSPDTEETLRLATQKLKQAPQQPVSTNIPHAYVIPIPVMSSTENIQNISGYGQSSETGEIIGSTNGPTTVTNHAQYQFAPIISDVTTIGSTSGGSLVTPTPIVTSGANAGYVHYHDPSALTNFQTFSYTPHGGFFLPAGYRLVYAPTGTPQSQPATPATPHLGNSHDGTPPGERQHEQPQTSNSQQD